MTHTTSVFTQITKSAPQSDGTLMVYGKATGSDLDLDDQRMEPGWLRAAMAEFMRVGNIREQHDSKRAVGKAVEHEEKPDGHYIKVHVVDPIAVKKTQTGVFTGFSVGISKPVITKAADAPKGLISGGFICEISLVDRPCLPTATLSLCKLAAKSAEADCGCNPDHCGCGGDCGPDCDCEGCGSEHYEKLAYAVTDSKLRAGYMKLAGRSRG